MCFRVDFGQVKKNGCSHLPVSHSFENVKPIPADLSPLFEECSRRVDNERIFRRRINDRPNPVRIMQTRANSHCYACHLGNASSFRSSVQNIYYMYRLLSPPLTLAFSLSLSFHTTFTYI